MIAIINILVQYKKSINIFQVVWVRINELPVGLPDIRKGLLFLPCIPFPSNNASVKMKTFLIGLKLKTKVFDWLK